MKLPLRIGVGIVLLNNKNKIFVAKRIDNPKNFWQMPQGGVDNKEKYLKAALRELKEETSITSVELIKEIDEWYTYELPEYLLGKIWKGKFRGQKQKWFIMKFLGNENEIKLNTKNPEFFEWKWIKIDELTNVVVKFKFDVYKKIYEELKKL
ncbi:MAG: RNA pyrophosphohydrolase [Candidatus Pelagibacterales bacterium]|mgnify:FL=1|nr:RNA pyrophosphohydrolase [Candidatus Pelagibacter sp.]RZO61693.1 MAG: RNA pyrophosphohydrolase [Pelagibacterales bacterium]|tara:strand:+ start:2241 stop:2696 length:456 start_codon:yes stop_codon:yes gene_type:complete